MMRFLVSWISANTQAANTQAAALNTIDGRTASSSYHFHATTGLSSMSLPINHATFNFHSDVPAFAHAEDLSASAGNVLPVDDAVPLFQHAADLSADADNGPLTQPGPNLSPSDGNENKETVPAAPAPTEAPLSFHFHSDVPPDAPTETPLSFHFHSDVPPATPTETPLSFHFHSDDVHSKGNQATQLGDKPPPAKHSALPPSPQRNPSTFSQNHCWSHHHQRHHLLRSHLSHQPTLRCKHINRGLSCQLPI
jgi:hypothetical protein